MGPLRPRPAPGPARRRRSRARPLPALQGPRPGRLLRGPGREGLPRRRPPAPASAAFDSPLGYHPDHLLVPGVEISSGSLGHGLPIAVGTTPGPRGARARARARVLPRGRRRARRGQQLGGGAARRPARPGPPDRGRGRQPLLDLPLAGRDRGALRARGLERGHRRRPRPRRARARADGDRRAAARGRRGGGSDDHHAQALLRARDARARRRSAHGARPRRDRRLRAPAPRARVQRRHPRAAHDRRGRRPRLRGAAAGRALLRALRRRAPLRADQARPRPPGRRGRPRQHRRVLRRRPVGPHAPGARRRRAAVGAAGLDHPRPRPPRRARGRVRCAPSPATTASTSGCPRSPTRRRCAARG